jgi:hypothetical protein
MARIGRIVAAAFMEFGSLTHAWALMHAHACDESDGSQHYSTSGWRVAVQAFLIMLSEFPELEQCRRAS